MQALRRPPLLTPAPPRTASRLVAHLVRAASAVICPAGDDPVHEPTSFLYRTTARRTANNLSARLRLGRRRFSCLPIRVASCRVLARRDRFLLLNLLALVVVTNAIAGTARDLHALIAVGLEAEIAHERADASRLCLQCIDRVDASKLHVELGAGIFVEQRQRALRRGAPVIANINNPNSRNGITCSPPGCNSTRLFGASPIAYSSHVTAVTSLLSGYVDGAAKGHPRRAPYA